MYNLNKLISLIKQKKNFAWLILGQIISLIFGFLIIKLITKIGSSQYGIYSLILTISALISAIFVGPSEQGFVRYFFSFKGDDNKKRVLNVIYLFSSVVLCIILIFTLLSLYLKIVLDTNLIILGFFIFLFTFSNFFMSIFNLIQKRKLNTFIIIFEKILLTILLYFFQKTANLNINTVLVSFCISVFVGIFLRITFINKLFDYSFFRDIKKISNREYIIYKYVFIFSIPLIIWGFSGWLASNGDRWIIAHFTNLQTVGIYSLMMSLSSYLIATPIGVIGQYFQPIIFENINFNSLNIKSDKHINEFLRTCFLVIIIGILFSILFGKIVITYIAINFNSFWYFLPLFTLSIGLFQLAQAYTIYGIIYEKPRVYLLPKILLGIISLILNIIGIYYFQIIGLTISIILSNFFYLIMIWSVNKKLIYNINR